MEHTVSLRRLRGDLLLLLTALIWGVAFVAQKSGGEGMGALTCNGVRSLICVCGLLVAIPVFDHFGLGHKPQNAQQRRLLWKAGVLCGLAMFSATNLQQIGLAMPGVSEGKGAFVTALYIVLVPLLGSFFGRRPGVRTWLGVGIAVVGLYLLCAKGESGFGLVDRYSPLVDGVRLSCIQFLVVGILNLPLMFLFETPTVAALGAHIGELLYLGLLSSGVGYTLQIIAQKDAAPTAASLIMSLESVFGALAGWLIAGHPLGIYEIIGCVLMFGAIVLAQLPASGRKKRENT